MSIEQLRKRGRPKKATNEQDIAAQAARKKAIEEANESIEFYKFKVAKAKQKVARLEAQIKKIESEEIEALEAKVSELKKKASEIKKG